MLTLMLKRYMDQVIPEPGLESNPELWSSQERLQEIHDDTETQHPKPSKRNTLLPGPDSTGHQWFDRLDRVLPNPQLPTAWPGDRVLV